MDSRKVNLIPFHAPVVLHGKTDFGEIILNVIIFIPFGIYAGMVFEKWRFGKYLLLFFLSSLLLEATQFVCRIGAFDSTDIITNTFGGIIGCLLFKAIEKLLRSTVKAQKLINILAGLGTVLLLLFLVLLKTNRLWIRYQ